MTEQTWPAEDLNDYDDPMTVDLGGPCSMCETDVDPDTGVCGQGHGDMDRYEADRALRRLLAAGAVGVVDVTVTEVTE